jgi:hypothetical protein
MDTLSWSKIGNGNFNANSVEGLWIATGLELGYKLRSSEECVYFWESQIRGVSGPRIHIPWIRITADNLHIWEPRRMLTQGKGFMYKPRPALPDSPASRDIKSRIHLYRTTAAARNTRDHLKMLFYSLLSAVLLAPTILAFESPGNIFGKRRDHHSSCTSTVIATITSTLVKRTDVTSTVYTTYAPLPIYPIRYSAHPCQ